MSTTKNISELMEGITKPKKAIEKKPPHELAAIVDEIQKSINFDPTNKKYGYKYWLGVVNRSKVTYNQILGILKEIEGVNSKYNKAGLLTNNLNKLCPKTKNPKKIKI